MINAELQFTLPVPPEEAFNQLSDPAKDPEWQSACVKTRLLNGPAEAGCRYEITFRLIGRQMKFTVEILAYEPGVCSEFKTLEGPFGYVGRHDYTKREDGTADVHWRFDVDPGDYFGITPHSLVKKLLIAQVKKDSGRLAAQLGGRRTASDTQEPS